MLRDTLIKNLRLIAKIDALEDGNFLDEAGVIDAINAVADENDRLESELLSSKKLNADILLGANVPASDDKEDEEEPEDIDVEDYLNLD